MEIILLQDIDKVGDKHTIVTVKNGYGRNYLLPRGFAVLASPAAMKQAEAWRSRAEARRAQLKAAATAPVPGVTQRREVWQPRRKAPVEASASARASATRCHSQKPVRVQYRPRIR